VPGAPQLVLRLDPAAVRASGLEPGLVGRLVRLHVDGEVVAEMRYSEPVDRGSNPRHSRTGMRG